jgi:hypothetical protein
VTRPRLLLVILLILGGLTVGDAQDAVAPPSLETKVGAYFQKLYSDNMQGVYKTYHPWGGHATAITVTGVKVTQWRNGVATEQGSDVVQFTVDYTILWSSILHPKGTGHTEARSTYSVTENKIVPVGRTIVSTNGKHTADNQGTDLIHLAELAWKF